MTIKTVLLKIKDSVALNEIEKIISAAHEYTITTENTAHHDLLVLEITDKEAEQQFKFVKGIIASGKVGHLFLISGVTDPDILIQILKIGPKEFFQLPLNRDDFRNALLKVQTAGPARNVTTSNAPSKNGTIIHIMGAKGGVGTTTIAVNLARALVNPKGSRTVALMDMNILFSDVPIFLNIDSPFDWAEIVRNISRLDSNFLMGTLFKHSSGLYVLPSPTKISESFTSEGADIITKLLELMRTLFDYVVIDGGQDLSEMSKAIMKLADRVIIVSLLNLPCLVNVKRLRDTFLRLGYPSDDRVSVIANRVHKRSGNVSVEDAERTTKKKIAWTISNDFRSTMDAINIGKTLQEIAPSSDVTSQIAEIAAFFVQQNVVEKNMKRRGLFGIFS